MYIESKNLSKTFGEHVTIHPGPVPLAEIFLAEFSGESIKVHAVEVGAAAKKALEYDKSRGRMLQEDVESGSSWVAAGTRRMLVASKAFTLSPRFVLTIESEGNEAQMKVASQSEKR